MDLAEPAIWAAEDNGVEPPSEAWKSQRRNSLPAVNPAFDATRP